MAWVSCWGSTNQPKWGKNDKWWKPSFVHNQGQLNHHSFRALLGMIIYWDPVDKKLICQLIIKLINMSLRWRLPHLWGPAGWWTRKSSAHGSWDSIHDGKMLGLGSFFLPFLQRKMWKMPLQGKLMFLLLFAWIIMHTITLLLEAIHMTTAQNLIHLNSETKPFILSKHYIMPLGLSSRKKT